MSPSSNPANTLGRNAEEKHALTELFQNIGLSQPVKERLTHSHSEKKRTLVPVLIGLLAIFTIAALILSVTSRKANISSATQMLGSFGFDEMSHPTIELSDAETFELKIHDQGNFSERDLEDAELIDPDNGLFLLWRASEHAEKAYETIHPSAADRKTNPDALPELKIIDHAAIESAVTLIETALSKDFIISRSSDIGHRRAQSYPTPIYYEDRIPAITAGFSTPSTTLTPFRKTADILSIKLRESLKEKDDDQLQHWITQATHFSEIQWHAPNSLIDFLISTSITVQLSKDIEQAAKHLGNEALAAQMQTRHDALMDLKNQFRPKRTERIPSPIVWKREAEVLSALASAEISISHSPDLRPNYPDYAILADLKPGRMIEHNLARGIFARKTSLNLLVIAAILSLLSLFVASPLRRIAECMRCLLTAKDWLITFLISTIIPVGLYGLIQFTPLSLTQYSFFWFHGIPFATQSLAVFLGILSGGILSLRWRYHLRFPMKHRFPMSWHSWWPYLLCLSSIPLTALVMLVKGPFSLWTGMLPLVPVLIWLLIPSKSAATLATKLYRQWIRITLAPLLILSALIFATLVVTIAGEREKHWVTQDRYLVFHSNPVGIKFEHTIAKELIRRGKKIMHQVKFNKDA